LVKLHHAHANCAVHLRNGSEHAPRHTVDCAGRDGVIRVVFEWLPLGDACALLAVQASVQTEAHDHPHLAADVWPESLQRRAWIKRAGGVGNTDCG